MPMMRAQDRKRRTLRPFSPRRRARLGSRLKDFDGSSMAIFRPDLADYHQLRCPVDGELMSESYHIDGDYYTGECRVSLHVNRLMS